MNEWKNQTKKTVDMKQTIEIYLSTKNTKKYAF